MSSVNKVIIVGYLGNDPEVRYSQNGSAIANVSIATSETWKDKQTGEKKESTEWHRVIFFGKLGEIVGEYLHKGSLIYVEGSLKTRKWQDKDGADRYTTEVIASGMKMLGGRQQAQQPQQAPQRKPTQYQPQNPAHEPDDPYGDSIPF